MPPALIGPSDFGLRISDCGMVVGLPRTERRFPEFRSGYAAGHDCQIIPSSNGYHSRIEPFVVGRCQWYDQLKERKRVITRALFLIP
jgi:hypothetical protein